MIENRDPIEFCNFKNIINSSGVAVSMYNITDSALYINQALRNMLDYSDIDDIRDFSKIYADPELYKKVFNKVKSGFSYKGEADLFKRDGSEVAVFITADPVKNEEGDVVCIVTFYTDISKQRLNEKRRRLLLALQMKLLKPYLLKDKMSDITDTVLTALNADFARIWLLKSKDICNKGCIHSNDNTYPVYCLNNNSCLHLTSSSGLYTNLKGSRYRIPKGFGNIGKIASGETDRVIIDDLSDNAAVENHDWLKENGLISFAGYKLTDSENKCNGVLAFFSKEQISPDIDSFAESLSHLASQVIMNSDSENEIKDALNLAERVNTLMTGREARIRDIKMEVNQLLTELGKKPRYFDVDIEGDLKSSEYNSEFSLKDAVNNALSLAEDAEIARRETAELNEQILRIQQAVDSSSDAIAISTSVGGFFYTNRTFTDFFGYSVSELAMCEVNELFSSKVTGRLALKEAGSGNSWKGEAEIITRDSSHIPVLLRVDPFKNSENEILGLIWIFTDITERKFAEDTIYQYAKAMEKDLDDKREMLKKARYLQNSFIQNTLPTVKEFNIFTLFMPCEKLGGDFFRIARGNFDNKIVIIIGDCTGHGINASLDASLLASLSESNLSYLFKGNRTDLFLNKVNSEFIKYADEDQFPTMFAAVVDLSTKEMFYSNANSELPVRINDKEIKKLDPVRGLHISYFD